MALTKTKKPEIGKWYSMCHSDNEFNRKLFALKYLHSSVKLEDDGTINYYFRPCKIYNSFKKEIIVLSQEDIENEIYILFEEKVNEKTI